MELPSRQQLSVGYVFASVFKSQTPESGVQASVRQDAGWLNPIVNVLDQILTTIQSSLDTLHVPYSYGWSIILLTLLTKVFTFPFTKIQVSSTSIEA